MSDITITYLDDVYVKVSCAEQSTAMEIVDYFTFDVPNAKFIPSFRHKMWDGKIRLFNAFNQLLYGGLVSHLIKFASERNYKVSFAEGFPSPPKTITPEEISKYLETLKIHSRGVSLTPLDHQLNAIGHAINHSRCLLLSPTASGKSYIIYSLIRYLMENLKLEGTDKKLLLVVPNVSLIHQMHNDFKDYSSENGWNVPDNVHLVYEGQNKNTVKPVVISTYQSIYKMPKEYFKQFVGAFCDECHQLKSASIKGIFEKLSHCPFRVGLTGTLDGMQTNQLVIEGLTGRVHRVTTTKQLMEAGILSNLKIDCITLKHSDSERQAVRKMTYQEEIDYLVRNEKRNQFIVDLAIHTKGNTLILFQFVEKHGKILHEMLCKKLEATNRPVYYVSGETEGEIRESIRQAVDLPNSIILTFGNKEIKVLRDSQIPLANGTSKKSQDITTEDDVDDKWVNSQLV